VTAADPAPEYGYQVVAGAVRAAGVDTVFGLLGNSNLATVGVLARQGVRFVGSRHESGAVGLAAGYAWATGRPAACTVSHGPGLANALTALTSAVRDRLPVVLLVADVRDRPPWTAQRADQPAMVGWTGAGLLGCPDLGGLAGTVAAGFGQAARQRRPVVINFPVELLDGPAAAQLEPPPLRRSWSSSADSPTTSPENSMIDASEARAAAGALGRAHRPVVLAGRGAVWSGAGPALRELAAAGGALLTTTLPAHGLFAGDQYDLGVCGGYSTRTTRQLLREADCVLVVGASLNGYTTAGGTTFPQARIIHCDADPAAFGRYAPADLTVAGDAVAVARAVAAELPAGAGRRSGWRNHELAGRIAAARGGADYPDRTDRTGIDPRAALRCLDRLLPADRQVVIDLGHFSTFPSQVLSVPGPGRFGPALGFGSVGLAVATATGAAAGRPVATVAVVGDGGLLMSLGELETLARHRLPVTVVVLDDHAYGAEIHHLRRHGLPEELADFPPRDLAAVSAALGLAAGTADTPAELVRLVGSLPRGGPALLDIRVTRAAIADRFQPDEPPPAATRPRPARTDRAAS
jgi:thiamine pyrophosphate-dependent acetolactate synthase large subunit-like protein